MEEFFEWLNDWLNNFISDLSAGGASKGMVPMLKLAGRPANALLQGIRRLAAAYWAGFATMPPAGKAIVGLLVACYLAAGGMYELEHNLAWVPFSGVLLIPAGCLAVIAYTRTVNLFKSR